MGYGSSRIPRLGYREWTSTTCNTSIYPAPWQAPLSNQSLPRMNKHHVQHYILRNDRPRLATSLFLTDSIPHEGPCFFPLVQPWRSYIFLFFRWKKVSWHPPQLSKYLTCWPRKMPIDIMDNDAAPRMTSIDVIWLTVTFHQPSCEKWSKEWNPQLKFLNFTFSGRPSNPTALNRIISCLLDENQ